MWLGCPIPARATMDNYQEMKSLSYSVLTTSVLITSWKSYTKFCLKWSLLRAFIIKSRRIPQSATDSWSKLRWGHSLHCKIYQSKTCLNIKFHLQNKEEKNNLISQKQEKLYIYLIIWCAKWIYRGCRNQNISLSLRVFKY